MDPGEFIVETANARPEVEVKDLVNEFIRFKIGPHTMATKKFRLYPDTNGELLQQMREDFGDCSDLEEELDYDTDEETIEANKKFAKEEVIGAIKFFKSLNQKEKNYFVTNSNNM